MVCSVRHTKLYRVRQLSSINSSGNEDIAMPMPVCDPDFACEPFAIRLESRL
jgi:hypothetical protein